MLKHFLRLPLNNQIKQVYKTVCCNDRKSLTTVIKSNFEEYNLKISRYCSACCNVRYFTKTSCHKAKVFVDSENQYAYNILHELPVNYSDPYFIKSSDKVISTTEEFNSILDKPWRSSTGSEIVNCFKSVLEYCIQNNINVSDTQFDKLTDGLMDRVEELTRSQLSELLICLSKYPACESFQSHNFHDIWSALDDICCWRLNTWNTDTLFEFADYWYKLNLGRICNYTSEFINRIGRKPQRLTKDQLLQSFFYINVARRRFMIFEFEHELEKIVDQLSINELAVVAMGYFKSQSHIKLKHIQSTMIRKVKEERKTCHEISLTAILKVLRFSNHITLQDQIMDLLTHLVPEIDRLSNVCCLHMALLGTNYQLLHEKVLEKVSQKLVNNIDDIDNIRLKDIERILVVLTMFNFDPKTMPCIFEAINGELHREERRKEMIQYPRCLPRALHFLTLRNMYCCDLMDRVFDMDFIVDVYGKQSNYLPGELLSLDISIDIECPGYRGNRLGDKLKYKTARYIAEYIPMLDQKKKHSATDKFMLDVIDSVADITGDKKRLFVNHVLPNFPRADIVVCKDRKSGNFVEPTGLEDYILGDIMRPKNADSLKWYSIVIVGINNTIRNTTLPLGILVMKQRQLRCVGYEPILVIWNEFLPLSSQDRINYILQKF